jgi:hypothetical protein
MRPKAEAIAKKVAVIGKAGAGVFRTAKKLTSFLTNVARNP